jgi:RNA polymerase sigma-70 factor (ECF subfamily)
LTDQHIISTVLSGETEVFRELVKRYEARVAATVIGMLGKCPEAEDVGQETFIRLYNNLANFRGEASVATYLTRIAINLSLNELKRRKRKSLFFWSESDTDIEIPDKNTGKNYNGEKELVQQAIQKLEPKFRSVVVLRLIDGFSTEETASILNVPVGTVLSRLARAQQKLKNILAPYMEGR